MLMTYGSGIQAGSSWAIFFHEASFEVTWGCSADSLPSWSIHEGVPLEARYSRRRAELGHPHLRVVSGAPHWVCPEHSYTCPTVAQHSQSEYCKRQEVETTSVLESWARKTGRVAHPPFVLE